MVIQICHSLSSCGAFSFNLASERPVFNFSFLNEIYVITNRKKMEKPRTLTKCSNVPKSKRLHYVDLSVLVD